MQLSIVGGGVFLGAAALRSALAGGHRVTVFSRGRSCSVWPARVEVLTGDRSADLSPLDPRGSTTWDTVIDTCAGVSGDVPADVPADMRASARVPGGCGSFLFVSSVPACATTSRVQVPETDALASAAGIAPDDLDPEHCGPQKVACEAEVQAAFCDRGLIVRPGLIAGPGDHSGHFSQWPWRVTAGGETRVPMWPTT